MGSANPEETPGLPLLYVLYCTVPPTVRCTRTSYYCSCLSLTGQLPNLSRASNAGTNSLRFASGLIVLASDAWVEIRVTWYDYEEAARFPHVQ